MARKKGSSTDNQQYTGGKVRETPFLNETDIKQAFKKFLSIQEKNEAYSEKRWRELVETVSVQPDRKLIFTLTDGSKHTIAPKT